MSSSTKFDVAEASPVSALSAGWFPGLDGVRAVAVALVFSVHYIGRYTIGWSGVMIFFVLSGFLITGVLYDARNEEHRFRNFYVRRTLRIFPLYYFVWLCIVIAGLSLRMKWQPILYLWPTYLGNFARFAVGNSSVDHIYTSKSWLPIEIGHFWSLAVEEQFYLIWPLVVFKLGDRRILMRICIGACILVLILRTVLTYTLPAPWPDLELFYRVTVFQADGFLFGGLLALLMRGPHCSRVIRSGNLFLGSALAALVLACLLNGPGRFLANIAPSSHWMSSYGFTLINLTSGGLLLCALNTNSWIARVLAFKPLRLLGRYSYGFYVYHVLLRPILILPLGNSPSHLAVLLSAAVDFLVIFVVSAASYRFIELPFLQLKNRFSGKRPGARARLTESPEHYGRQP